MELKSGEIKHGEQHDRRQHAYESTLTMALVVTCCSAALACGGLMCYFGQVGRRMKNMRYRWQIRYREVSGVETTVEPTVKPKVCIA